MFLACDLRDWVAETAWLPKADGYLLGQKLGDWFTLNVHGTAGYAQLKTTHQPPPAYFPTDISTNTGRVGVGGELSMPLDAGPFKIVPYVRGDATYYTEDLLGDDRARLYGAFGIRGSIPFSSAFP